MIGEMLLISIVLGPAMSYAFYLLVGEPGQGYLNWCDKLAEEISGDAWPLYSGGIVPFRFFIWVFLLMVFFYPISSHVISWI